MGGNKVSSKDNSVGYLSDKGNVREVNEDYVGYYEDDSICLYIVADGMGGHNAGDVASRVAVESCIDYVKKEKSKEDMISVLKSAIIFANQTIFNMSKKNQGLNGMGTTITSCLIHDRNVIVSNVGDSSCFLIEKDKVTKITKDHSLVQELIDDGSITEKEALTHPNKNIITRALGTNSEVDVDIYKLPLNRSSKFLLCTDGLSNVVSKDEMHEIISKNNNKEACKLLVDLCKNKGGRDNISVIVFGGEC